MKIIYYILHVLVIPQRVDGHKERRLLLITSDCPSSDQPRPVIILALLLGLFGEVNIIVFILLCFDFQNLIVEVCHLCIDNQISGVQYRYLVLNQTAQAPSPGRVK